MVGWPAMRLTEGVEERIIEGAMLLTELDAQR